MLSASSLPSIAARATHVQAPGRRKSRSAICASTPPSTDAGTTSGPATEPSALTVALRAQRVSASPPGGAHRPHAGERAVGQARSAVDERASDDGRRHGHDDGERRPSETALPAPVRQSVGPPEAGPTPTLTRVRTGAFELDLDAGRHDRPAGGDPSALVQNGVLSGWVGWPSGTPAICSAARCAPGRLERVADLVAAEPVQPRAGRQRRSSRSPACGRSSSRARGGRRARAA